jgi:hypothetical protein
MPDGSGARYTVIFVPREIQRVRSLAVRAQELGILPQLTAAVRTITRRLADEPSSWGDPTHRLHHLGLLKHVRVYGFLRVYYAVDEARRIVYVTDVLPLSGHPLEGDG